MTTTHELTQAVLLGLQMRGSRCSYNEALFIIAAGLVLGRRQDDLTCT
jgi:hypothetical protein